MNWQFQKNEIFLNEEDSGFDRFPGSSNSGKFNEGFIRNVMQQTSLKDAFNRANKPYANDKEYYIVQPRVEGFLKAINDPNPLRLVSSSQAALPMRRETPVPVIETTKPKPLPNPLNLISGFYFDDEQVGWEIGEVPFEEPRSVVFCMAVQSKNKTYDIVEVRIPVKQDEEDFLVFDYARPIGYCKSFDDAPRATAIWQTAAFSNASMKDASGIRHRALPRLPDFDPGFMSLLRSIDMDIGNSRKLSDVVNCTHIEDVISHPDLEKDLPEFTHSEKIDLDTLPAGVTVRASVIQPADLREKVTASPYRFRVMDIVRTIERTTSPVSESGRPVDPLQYKKPSLLMFAFDREHYKRLELFNEFARALRSSGIEIISLSQSHTKNPFQGSIFVKNGSGPIMNLTLSSEYKRKYSHDSDAVIFNFVSNDCDHLNGWIATNIFHGSRYDCGHNPAIKPLAERLARAVESILQGECYFNNLLWEDKKSSFSRLIEGRSKPVP